MQKRALGLWAILGIAAWGQGNGGQAPGQTATPTGAQVDRATAYYHYTLGHMYAELAGETGDRSYVSKAIDNYKAAIQADPQSPELSEELTELYVQTGRLREAQTDAETTLAKNPNDLPSLRLLAKIYTSEISGAQRNGIDQTMLQKAIDTYKKITTLDAQDIDAWLMLARLDAVTQNNTEAEAAFNKALGVDPDSEDALLGLASLYASEGKSQEAADTLRKRVDKDPSPRALQQLAATYAKMRQFGLAADALRQALNLNPPNGDEIRRSLAETLVNAGRFADAILVYQDLAADDPMEAGNWLSISQLYIKLRDFPKASEASAKARNIDPKDLKVQFNDVTILEAQDKTADAIQLVKQMLSSTVQRNYNADESRRRIALVDHLATLYRDSGQPDQAAQTYTQITDLDPELGPNVGVDIIETYIDAHQFPKAQMEADADLKKWPGDRALHIEHARLAADMGKADQGAAEVKKLLDGTNDFEIDLAVAEIYDKGHKFEDVGKALDAAEKLAKGDDQKQRIWFMRGAMYERMKKLPESEAQFRKVLEVDPDSAGALNYLGYMLADRNIRLQEALDLIKKAVSQEPDNGAYLDSLGWVQFRLGQLDDSEKNLRRAVAKTPLDPTVHDHMAEVLMRQSKVKEAVSNWEKALKNWDDGPPADLDQAEVAKVKAKLDSARVRLAKETSQK
jgi:tetratricopeptide (TPR) repeat protein